MISFFIPDNVMLSWLIEYAADRFIFDIGCGNGSVIKAINNIVDDKAYGIDLLWDYEEPLLPVYRQNALESRLVRECKQSLVLFCRPCHSDWVENVIGFLPDGIEVLYIGLPENVEVDFYKYKLQPLEHSGKSDDNEVVYKVIR
jgi:hypothetical protein